MTHDLMRNLLGELGATVEAVEITELQGKYLLRAHRTEDPRGQCAAYRLAARPTLSRLRLRTKSPIYVAKAVLEVSSELHEAASDREAAASDQNLAGVSRDKWSEILEKMSPDDFKYKM